MRWLPVCAIIALVLAGPVRAGAWLRGEDTGFLAVTSTMRGPLELQMFETETALYGEYGLLENLTLGVDLNYRDTKSGHGLVFVRLPIGRTDRAWRFAGELGLGKHLWQDAWGNQHWVPMAKTAVSVGRGLPTKHGGWINVDTAVEWRNSGKEPLYKIDGIIGIGLWPKLDGLFKVETAYNDSVGFGWAVTPGLAWRQNERNRLVLGVEFREVADWRTTGLTLSFWRDF